MPTWTEGRKNNETDAYSSSASLTPSRSHTYLGSTAAQVVLLSGEEAAADDLQLSKYRARWLATSVGVTEANRGSQGGAPPLVQQGSGECPCAAWRKTLATICENKST
mmetsp:Transcript_47232/g.103341  ORF Transcript_47232/g.103341 Transcript_47232/m.103341 type:complete len:108 (+) Transcript_47232:1-324(+)